MKDRKKAYIRAHLHLLTADIDVIRTSVLGGEEEDSIEPPPEVGEDNDPNKGEWD